MVRSRFDGYPLVGQNFGCRGIPRFDKDNTPASFPGEFYEVSKLMGGPVMGYCRVEAPEDN